MKKMILICFLLLAGEFIFAQDVNKLKIPPKDTLSTVKVKFHTMKKRKDAMQALKKIKEKVSVRLGPTRLYFGPVGKGVGLTLKF